jgi:hypothetical protein
MRKLKAYKQACIDVETAEVICEELHVKLKELGTVNVNNSISIEHHSSDKQFIYALGVLNSQIEASKELGMDSEELEKKKSSLFEMRALSTDIKVWAKYFMELRRYKDGVEKLLSGTERFMLLVSPTKPKK